MVAYLSKSDASEGFNQIIDFLNGSSIKYALTVNLNIYVSCIKQFWTTVAVKQCMSAKRTSWNEFSSSMASAVICLSSEVNTGDATKGDDSATHGEVPAITEELSIPSPTTPTPPPQPPQDIPSTSQVKKMEKRNKVRVLKLRRLQKVGTSQRVETSDDTIMDDESNQERMIAEIDQDDAVVLMDDKEEDKEVSDAVKMLKRLRVAAAPSRRRKGEIIRDPKEELTTSTIIPAETKSKDKGKGILVEEPKPLKKKQQIKQDEQYARELHAELNKVINWDEAIDHVKLKAKEDPAVKRYQVLKRKPQTEAQARKNMMIYLKNVASFKLDYFKGMSYNDILPIFEAKFNSNVDFLFKDKRADRRGREHITTNN
uniref:Xylulose kinase-1 n=1 Tax=Tanacetum cinerariifolium TaxID=118510 RepID=A0A6L2LYZ3_TANCI|nr:hypothetical protein [Tanacetum cinerariifolium]